MSAATHPFRGWGPWAILAGALALLLVIVQIADPFRGPERSAGQQIGEIAGEMRREAWRSFLGLKPAEPVPPPVADGIDWLQVTVLAAPVFGIAAILLSLVSGLRGENRRFWIYGTALGSAAILFQLFWWLALLILGVLLLIAIIENIGDIFGGLFG